MFLDFLLIMAILASGAALLAFIVLSIIRGLFKKGPSFKFISLITGVPFLALFILTFILALNIEPTEQVSTAPEKETQTKQAETEKTFTPELKIASEVIDNQVEISGETNFPDETALLVTLKDSKDKNVEKAATVQDGKFSLDAIPIEELKSGKQEIKVSLHDDQPDSVIEVIGLDGKLLAGKFVDDEKQLKVSAKVDVPSERSPPSDVKGEKVKVTRVVDGDTIEVDLNGKSEKVRMILVDTPETKHPRLGVQPFGPEASKFTTKTLENQMVTLELGTQERDKYGRLLAYVWIEDKLFNNMLLEKGFARVAVYPPNTKYLDEFEATQEKAKKKGIGIWAIENYAQDDGFKEPEREKEKAVAIAPKKDTNQPPLKKAEPKPEPQPKKQVAQPEPKAETNPAPQPKPETKPAPAPKPEPKPAQDQAACNIKGSQNGIYHVPGSTYYDRTTNVAQWFCSEQEAQNAGYRAPKR
ncbi:thermonuclease family protein [Siminovitchia fordii]|uniref:thermonuclease family protein n=1 Tax=Siminovitchia fordii TaxID=254759 RepID=UPI00035ED04D